ncbi:hypothetical protein DICSQDRAFT_132515 [Dichomitus squalens LYAD-421 SS1]|uniref:uncharacterized protein n=1 Tax=Dichomitus squalens (strain LYAD-421) TaxID=732165 RepID=UPI00044119C5|nr:uncharacterized protein DICSQDRAFT_132515 [Dichomitus squalens LYAD-421 SS1]EJF65004.1 hypothetical protein DICSQDRAFT_132515 [Dichomitus squalens LYAD-421 SS1]
MLGTARPSEDPRPTGPERANPRSPFKDPPVLDVRKHACQLQLQLSDAHAGGVRTQPIARHVSVTAPEAARCEKRRRPGNSEPSAQCSGAICTDTTDAKPRPPTRAACLWV